MKIAVISPTFPPDHCGIGDYSARVVEEFLNRNEQVSVWSCQKNPQANYLTSNNFKYFYTPRPWGPVTFCSFLIELKKFSPEAVIVQYIPYLFAKKWGIHPLLPFWILILRFILYLLNPSISLLLIVHESNYPVRFDLKGICLGLPQWFQFVFIFLICPKISFTFESAYKKYKNFFFWKWLYLIPVGANIKRVQMDWDIPIDEIVPKEAKILLHFGGAHPTNLFEYEFAAFDAIFKNLKNTKLVFVGLTQEKINVLLDQYNFSHLKSAVIGLGYLMEAEVSVWISRSYLVLAPFLDGISTRRTSAMAAFDHGKPLLTTRSWSTNSSIAWEEFCFIVPMQEKQKFIEKAVFILENSEEAKSTGERGKKYYDAHFSYPVITNKILSIINFKN
ncbi:MAG: glycosyltransferase family 4 protein [Bdellovibrio sp.]|nr:glycosyltransferase family 4 protein [Bdellovibrio sp.]